MKISPDAVASQIEGMGVQPSTAVQRSFSQATLRFSGRVRVAQRDPLRAILNSPSALVDNVQIQSTAPGKDRG
jgi:hypothetical protein